MNLADGISTAYSNKWSFNNTFSVQFHFNQKTNFETIISPYNTEKINLNIINIQLPEFSNAVIETWVGDRWRTHNSRDNLYRYSITFRDMDQLALYRAWVEMYNRTKFQYFDNVAFTTLVYKDEDWLGENENLLVALHNSIIDSVSQVTFSNDTQGQIAEFTVNYRCTAPYVNNFKG